jgi:hypothetical protein
VRIGLKPHFLLTFSLTVLSLSGCGAAASDVRTDSVRTFSGYHVYWLGQRFEQWKLTKVLGPGSFKGGFSFIYGDCTPHDGDEPSCVPPLEVQVTALCPHLPIVAADPVWRQRRIRGAPVGTIDGAPVLFSRDSQIKIYDDGQHPGLALRALAALRSANEVKPVINASDVIPAASPAVLAGTRDCPRAASIG